ncbi:putative clathrin assembly protein At4g40080 [Cynara cardunculus var. scolymus]|uniref:AP180 N-terminal homology (ANTH) domain-containing protein n=1 Tax=Cynara cardunculus var. scolymus TaxID=59895 RepID=A0A103YGA2_CYNCS|nr:putative clathrin assembly protein At4g40080 [Cynara cardunculus var. scolymus]KVI08576.1 AP180 N-terminal homology (ANTH) domain-containing protein [Cynara cardunculus var. scolymus]
MGGITTMRDLIGIVKDKVSLSKLALLSKPHTLSLHLAVLRTTSHSPSTPPHDHHLATLLSLGDGSRATASIVIHSLMNRLHRTNDSYVALKCLLTIHHIINRGSFILKDQLSVHPSTGGRNNLKLSDFRDSSSATTWVLSAWVRWYARYLETILSTSKFLGFFICSSYSVLERENQQDSISSILNSDLIRDFGSLVGVVEELCKVPDNLLVERDRMLAVVMELLANDYLSTVNEILLRLSEFKERVNLLSFNDSVELASALDRLASCKETSLRVFCNRKSSMDFVWEMVDELNNRIGMVHLRKLERRDSGSESARFLDRVGKTSEYMRFSSGRLTMK